MDLGIAGRKAIVYASSRWARPRACAERLAGGRRCEVVLSRLNRERLEAAAADMRRATRRQDHRGRRQRRDAGRPRRRCSPPARTPTSSSTTTPGRPFAISRELDQQKMIDGVIANMVSGESAMTQKVIDPEW